MTERYIADSNLGRLAKWLRLLGVDVEYFGSGDLASLIERARVTSRKIITRRKPPLAYPAVFIRSCVIEEQVEAFYAFEGLKLSRDKFFSRCSECNRDIEEIGREVAASRGVPEYVLLSNERFLSCGDCKRVYWPGSHRERFLEKVEGLNLSGGEL